MRLATLRVDFPTKNEKPNDDDKQSDEDNLPKNDKIFSWDAPGTPRDADLVAFRVMRSTFEEFVRLRFGDKQFARRNNNFEAGTRCSPVIKWHLISYLRRSWGGKFWEDNDAVSASFPRRIAGQGNGAILVTPLGDAETEGYRLAYDKTDKKWTLVDRSGGKTEAADPGNRAWMLTLGDKVKVEITQGQVPFTDGAKFDFSVFKSQRKKNELALEPCNVRLGP